MEFIHVYTNNVHIICLALSDNMKPKIPWRHLDDSLLVEIPDETFRLKIEPGSNSQEKKIQFLREKYSMPTIYFTKDW